MVGVTVYALTKWAFSKKTATNDVMSSGVLDEVPSDYMPGVGNCLPCHYLLARTKP